MWCRFHIQAIYSASQGAIWGKIFIWKDYENWERTRLDLGPLKNYDSFAMLSFPPLIIIRICVVAKSSGSECPEKGSRTLVWAYFL
jgi:hypothetical protein